MYRIHNICIIYCKQVFSTSNMNWQLTNDRNKSLNPALQVSYTESKNKIKV
jgi:hypothetical protein